MCVLLVPASASAIVAAAAGITLVGHFLLNAAQGALDAVGDEH